MRIWINIFFFCIFSMYNCLNACVCKWVWLVAGALLDIFQILSSGLFVGWYIDRDSDVVNIKAVAHTYLLIIVLYVWICIYYENFVWMYLCTYVYCLYCSQLSLSSAENGLINAYVPIYLYCCMPQPVFIIYIFTYINWSVFFINTCEILCNCLL